MCVYSRKSEKRGLLFRLKSFKMHMNGFYRLNHKQIEKEGRPKP